MNLKLEHIVIGVLILAVFGVITIPGFQQPVTTAPRPAVTDGVVITCDSTVTPDIDINAYDVDNPNTAITDAHNLYRKKPGGSWVRWTLGTPITGLEFGETYEFLIPGALTIANAKANATGKYITWTAPCRENTEMKIYVANDETYDGLSASLYNATFGTKMKIGIGETEVYTLRWKAAKDEYYGHPYLTTYPMLSDNGNHRRQYPNVLCLKLNSTVWQEPVEVYLADGTKMNRISSPTISAADGAATHIMYCYEAPVITDRITEINVNFEADATYAPNLGADDTAFLYAGNLYINTDTGEVEWGVENDEASYTAGNGDADELTLDVT